MLVISIACREQPRWGTPGYEAEVGRLIIGNRCEEAISLLEAANARENQRWVELLVGAELDCGVKTGKRGYVESALKQVDEAISRFPTSSRLVFLKGFVNGRLGEHGVAQRYYLEALNLARANIAADPEGRKTADDRAVAKNAWANLSPGWRPAR